MSNSESWLKPDLHHNFCQNRRHGFEIVEDQINANQLFLRFSRFVWFWFFVAIVTIILFIIIVSIIAIIAI